MMTYDAVSFWSCWTTLVNTLRTSRSLLRATSTLISVRSLLFQS